MNCSDVERELVAYHFAVLGDDARASVERHLETCPRCVAAFVDTKRALEVEPPRAEAPRAAVRTRLRRAVAAELGIEATPRRIWERPIAFAVAASMVLAASAATRALTAPATPPHGIGSVNLEAPPE